MASVRVGIAKETDELLRIVGKRDLQTALDQERLFREKVEGVWLYGTASRSIGSARSAVRTALSTTLNEWFLVPTHPLAGYLAKNLGSPQVSKRVVQAFIRETLRREEFQAVATLTNEFEPYLALFAHDDEPELERQLDFVRGRLDSNGLCETGDLPAPQVVRSQNAWKWTLLRHAEYLGIGYTADRALVGWE